MNELPPGVLDSLLWGVRFHLWRRYRLHPWWEDLHAEGRLAAYRAVTEVVRPEAALSTIACNAAVWAVRDWLRSRKNEARWRSRTGAPIPQVVHWEELYPTWWDGDQAKANHWPGWIEEPRTVDFVDGLLTQIEGAQLIGWLRSDPRISPLAALLVERVTLNGEQARAVAISLGVSEWQSRKLRRDALAVLRERQETECG